MKRSLICIWLCVFAALLTVAGTRNEELELRDQLKGLEQSLDLRDAKACSRYFSATADITIGTRHIRGCQELIETLIREDTLIPRQKLKLQFKSIVLANGKGTVVLTSSDSHYQHEFKVREESGHRWVVEQMALKK